MFLFFTLSLTKMIKQVLSIEIWQKLLHMLIQFGHLFRFAFHEKKLNLLLIFQTLPEQVTVVVITKLAFFVGFMNLWHYGLNRAFDKNLIFPFIKDFFFDLALLFFNKTDEFMFYSTEFEIDLSSDTIAGFQNK